MENLHVSAFATSPIFSSVSCCWEDLQLLQPSIQISTTWPIGHISNMRSQFLLLQQFKSPFFPIFHWSFQPLWKIWKSIGMLTFPTEWKNHPFMFQSPPRSFGGKAPRSSKARAAQPLRLLSPVLFGQWHQQRLGLGQQLAPLLVTQVVIRGRLILDLEILLGSSRSTHSKLMTGLMDQTQKHWKVNTCEYRLIVNVGSNLWPANSRTVTSIDEVKQRPKGNWNWKWMIWQENWLVARGQVHSPYTAKHQVWPSQLVSEDHLDKSTNDMTEKTLDDRTWHAGWWFHPLWKIWKSIVMIISNIWENKKCSKPPTRYHSFFERKTQLLPCRLNNLKLPDLSHIHQPQSLIHQSSCQKVHLLIWRMTRSTRRLGRLLGVALKIRWIGTAFRLNRCSSSAWRQKLPATLVQISGRTIWHGQPIQPYEVHWFKNLTNCGKNEIPSHSRTLQVVVEVGNQFPKPMAASEQTPGPSHGSDIFQHL